VIWFVWSILFAAIIQNFEIVGIASHSVLRKVFEVFKYHVQYLKVFKYSGQSICPNTVSIRISNKFEKRPAKTNSVVKVCSAAAKPPAKTRLSGLIVGSHRFTRCWPMSVLMNWGRGIDVVYDVKTLLDPFARAYFNHSVVYFEFQKEDPSHSKIQVSSLLKYVQYPPNVTDC